MAEKKSEIEGPDSFIGTIVFFVGLAGVICLGGWALGFFRATYGVLGIFLLILAVLLNGLKVVPKPEIWIVERFGKYNRKLEPGLRWIIPFIESVRARPRLWEQSIPIFATQPKIDFRDGSATLKDPKIYIELAEDKAEDAIYKVIDWAKWVEDATEPIIRGYLNTLSITEALDEGGARGNLINRLRERPDITTQQINDIPKEIAEVDNKIRKMKKAGKDVGLLESFKEELKEKKKELETRLADQKRLKKEFKAFETEAGERGFKKVHRVVVAEFGLSDELIRAREKVHEEQKRAAAALYEATREAVLRTETITRTKERFVEAGFSEEDALRKAYELEIMETLANTGSLFLTSGREGGLRSIIAEVAAIVTEVPKRRREPKK